MPHRLVLASQSPRRRQLLEQLAPQLPFELVVLKPAPEENAEALEQPLAAELPQDYVQRVTLLKLQAGLARARAHGLGGLPVLASDTTVALGNEILGKPTDAADARRMLRALSGEVHTVLTAVALASDSQDSPLLQVSVSSVKFAHLTADWIDWVIATGEPMDKAGAYAIQGHAGAQIEWVHGSPSGIMGLPLFETQTLLQQVFADPS
jgi:septum formation protein